MSEASKTDITTGLKRLSVWNFTEIKETCRGRVVALVPVMEADRWKLGVAVANEPGYSPLPLSWCNIAMGPDAYDRISDYADIMNRRLGLTGRQAMQIVASTMRPNR
jgi:hypothetical protein